MVKEIIIPKENLAQVEEVREIENKDLEQKKDENQGSKVIEKLEETILPTVHASDKDDDDLDAKIEQADSLRDAIKNDKAEKRAIKQDVISNCDVS